MVWHYFYSSQQHKLWHLSLSLSISLIFHLSKANRASSCLKTGSIFWLFLSVTTLPPILAEWPCSFCHHREKSLYLAAFLSFSVQTLNIHLFLKMFRNTGPGYPKLCGLTHSQTIPEPLPRAPLFFSLQIDSFLLDCVRITIVYLARNNRKVPDWLSGCYWLTGRLFGKTVCIMFSASHCAQNWGKWSLEEEKKRIRLERDKAFLAGWVVQDVIQRSMYLREKLIKTNKDSYSCFCRSMLQFVLTK